MTTSHLDGPATVLPPATVHRVARSNSVLRFSEISPQDAELDKAGNRFDVVGGGVLYAATTEEACFAETLARFRVSPRIRQFVRKHDESGRMICGGVPADWRARRVKATLAITDPLPFVDVDAAESHEYIATVLAERLAPFAEDDRPLDVSGVRGHDRRLTRALAAWAYSATDDEGEPMYSGVRYVSRLGSDWECWAIFEGTAVEEVQLDVIQPNDPALQKIVDLWGLRLF